MDNRDDETRDAGENETRNERESIWSILSRWRTLYFSLFAIQNIAGISLLCWYEITQNTGDSAVETALAILKGSGMIGAGSASTTLTIMETARTIMVIAASLESWLKKRERARIERRVAEAVAKATAEVTESVTAEVTAAVTERVREEIREETRARVQEEIREETRARVLEEIREETLAEVNSAWSQWNRRRLEAAANGQPFDEPPPDFSSAETPPDNQSSPPAAGE